jgi:hypothetical protein
MIITEVSIINPSTIIGISHDWMIFFDLPRSGAINKRRTVRDARLAGAWTLTIQGNERGV